MKPSLTKASVEASGAEVDPGMVSSNPLNP
jgi:hypothetical protein